MHATDIIGWKADADHWCDDCATTVYGPDAEDGRRVDREGNEVAPILGTEEWYDVTSSAPETLSCNRCHAELDSVEGEPDADYLERFFDGYVECAVWASTDVDPGEDDRENADPLPLDDLGYGSDDIDADALQSMREECDDFVRGDWTDLYDLDPAQCGHDFWLTRNRHGAGFWDRGLGDRGERLTKSAHAYGSLDLYIGGDRSLYVSS